MRGGEKECVGVCVFVNEGVCLEDYLPATRVVVLSTCVCVCVCVYVSINTYLADIGEDLEGGLLDGGACVGEGLDKLEDDVGEELGDGLFLLGAGGFDDLCVCVCVCDRVREEEGSIARTYMGECMCVCVCIYTYIYIPRRANEPSLP
jgi:hypothetical protein